MKIRDRIKKLVRVPASELIPNPKNWRTHPEEQQNALRGVLAEVGIADALIARETKDGLQLIDGHLRADVDPSVEWPVLVLDVTEEEADKILATHDPLTMMAEVDDTMLSKLLDDVEMESADVQKMLDELPTPAAVDVEIVEDEVPETPSEPITQPGDLIKLGRHSLLCGDSTNKTDVKRLMAGSKATAVITDPPYGIGEAAGKNKMRGGQFGGKGNGGKYVRSRDYGHEAWDDKPIDGLVGMLSKFQQQIIFGGNYYPFPPTKCWLVWDKENGKNDFADCELAWTNLEKAVRIKRHLWNGMIRKNGEKRDHPTQKPLEVIAWAVGFTKGTVFDPFLGSGTTLIACEQLGRTCYGMEISPQYCDVIVERWEKLPGEKAKRPKRAD